MKINITSETTISFDIEVGNETAELRMDGGTWYLSQQGAQSWIGRVDWPEALKRALVYMAGAHIGV